MATEFAISKNFHGPIHSLFMHPQILGGTKTGFCFACHTDADTQADKKQKETKLSLDDQLYLSLTITQDYREIPWV